MFRTNVRSGASRRPWGRTGWKRTGWKRAWAGACMALTDSQIGLFMKQSQTGFMNSPGYSVNRRYSFSIRSTVASSDRISTRYVNVVDCPGSSVKFISVLPSVNTFTPSGFAANKP